MTTMNLTINNSNYANVPVDLAKAIETMLGSYKVTAKTAKSETKAPAKAKTKAKAPAKATPKEYAKVYSVTADGKGVTVGDNGFIPTKVFKGVTYSLKTAGAKYDSGNKAWMFGTKKACTEWCKAQDARA